MTVGWYVHHHGTGHLQRFLAVRPLLEDVVGLSSLARPESVVPERWVTLPLDAPAGPESEPEAGGALHWAPLGHRGLSARMAQIAEWLARERPTACVCDVSVEVALLIRLMGVPVVWIAQRGRRRDRPHQLAYSVATVIAPWTEALDSPQSGLPKDARHIGGLSRYDGRSAPPVPGHRQVSVLLGGGGHEVDAEQLRAAARATPDWTWTVAGLGEPVGEPARGGEMVSDSWPLLCAADVVVASGGGNLIAEVAAARRPLACLPQARPFDEQHDAARSLERAGLAEALWRWPAADDWAAVLRRAVARDPARWSALHDGRAGGRLAAAVDMAGMRCGSA